MKQIQLKQVGSFTKTHGVHGHLVLNINESVTDDLLDKGINEKEAVFVEIDGIPVPFFISENGIRELNPKSLLLALDEIDNNKAKLLITCKVYINTFYLSEIETGKLFDPLDLIGFLVKDKNLGDIGIVNDYFDLKENPLLSIDRNGQELLLPLYADFIIVIETDKNIIETNLPEGYIEALN